MANARVRELRLISALIAAGDPRKALTQARLAADLASRRPPIPPEQLVLLALPQPKREPPHQREERRPVTRPKPPEPPKPPPKRTATYPRPRYDTPDDRVMAAVIAVYEANSEDDRGFRAAWERLRAAAKPWITKEA